MMHDGSLKDAQTLKQAIRLWGRELGFAAISFAAPELGDAPAGLADWLAQGFHGGMDYMARNMEKRAQPGELVPGTRSIIVARLDYLPPDLPDTEPDTALISCYALGRDYHKVMRNRLQKLAERIEAAVGPFGYRAFADSAPVMEVELASRSGLGWRGKHTLLLSRSGSWFFLGELYTELSLPPDTPADGHCGNCDACLKSCPTDAFISPYTLDARRCISYLTIEHSGAIPKELRPLMGTRIYGCDDCQSACPWNRFARPAEVPDFLPRNGLEHARLAELFAWTETEFNDRLAGSPIRRIGHERWLRNISVALGNAPTTEANLAALKQRLTHSSERVREHVAWAIERHRLRDSSSSRPHYLQE
jgi:epoxyqueuosine reductase